MVLVPVSKNDQSGIIKKRLVALGNFKNSKTRLNKQGPRQYLPSVIVHFLIFVAKFIH